MDLFFEVLKTVKLWSIDQYIALLCFCAVFYLGYILGKDLHKNGDNVCIEDREQSAEKD